MDGCEDMEKHNAWGVVWKFGVFFEVLNAKFRNFKTGFKNLDSFQIFGKN